MCCDTQLLLASLVINPDMMLKLNSTHMQVIRAEKKLVSILHSLLDGKEIRIRDLEVGLEIKHALI